MPKYICQMVKSQTINITVEAKDEDSAIEKAWDKAKDKKAWDNVKPEIYHADHPEGDGFYCLEVKP